MCMPDILVQFRPKRLVPFARIHPGLGHRKEPLFTLLPLIVSDLIDFAPYLRLGTARDPVLWYHRPSSRMKSRQTKPQRTSLRIAVSDPVEDLNETFSPFPGGQRASLCSCSAVDCIVGTPVGSRFSCPLPDWACG